LGSGEVTGKDEGVVEWVIKVKFKFKVSAQGRAGPITYLNLE